MVGELEVTALVSDDCVRDEAACDGDDVELWGVEFAREFEVAVVNEESDDVVGVLCIVDGVTETLAEVTEETDRRVLPIDGFEMMEESTTEALLLILSIF